MMNKSKRPLKWIVPAIWTAGLLALPPANATEIRQDIPVTDRIQDNSAAQTICPDAVKEWRKKNCSSKTCTARWNGQWRNVSETSGKTTVIHGVCRIHQLERSSWTEQPLASRPLTSAEKSAKCRYNDKAVTNGWQYDDVCRDKLDMTTSHLNHLTRIDLASDPDTDQIIRGLRGEATSHPLPDGRYIFVLGKYANEPDRLGLVLRRYDRNVILPNGQICKNDQFSHAPNLDKTLPKGHPGHVRHSQLNGGWNPVATAGELWIQNGKIKAVSNESRHFRPSSSSLGALRETLEYLSIPTSDIHFFDVGKNTDELSAFKNSCAGGIILNWQQCQ